ncbi:MAG: F0F1 ATP synthase subunit delta [Patescibacteria group bacterium]
MTTTARHYAEALYHATGGASEQEASAAVQALCARLAREGRQDLLESVALAYRRVLIERNELPELFVESAEPLSDVAKRAVAQAFDADRDVAIRASVNEALVSGLVARYNTMYADVSISGKLEKLKRALTK